MSDKHFWFGYLEAGEKSSPVLRDSRIDTGNSATLYLFNLKRNEILEYRREIIEPKLRELKADEASVCAELQKAYGEARSQFTPRAGAANLSAGKAGKKTQLAANDDLDDDEDVVDFTGDDDDAGDEEWLEEEAAE